jgi:hypothetical protein
MATRWRDHRYTSGSRAPPGVVDEDIEALNEAILGGTVRPEVGGVWPCCGKVQRASEVCTRGEHSLGVA